MIELLHRLAGDAPRCDDYRCRQGRSCQGACTCMARVIQGHGAQCDGACEGECSDAGMTSDRIARRWANGLLALMGAWIVFLGVSFGALLSWAWQSGLTA